MRPQALGGAPYGMCLGVRKGEAYFFEELPCVGGSTHQGACTAALGGGSCSRGTSYPAGRMSPQQPSWEGSCSSSASRYRSGPQPRLHSATPPSTYPLHCLLLSISTKALNAAVCVRLKAAGTPIPMCTGHANMHALRVSLSCYVGTSMLGPCICTLSKDMRIGRDARMSHVAGRVHSSIRRISFIPAVQESLVGACFATALPLDRGLGHMRIVPSGSWPSAWPSSALIYLTART